MISRFDDRFRQLRLKQHQKFKNWNSPVQACMKHIPWVIKGMSYSDHLSLSLVLFSSLPLWMTKFSDSVSAFISNYAGIQEMGWWDLQSSNYRKLQFSSSSVCDDRRCIYVVLISASSLPFSSSCQFVTLLTMNDVSLDPENTLLLTPIFFAGQFYVTLIVKLDLVFKRRSLIRCHILVPTNRAIRECCVAKLVPFNMVHSMKYSV